MNPMGFPSHAKSIVWPWASRPCVSATYSPVFALQVVQTAC
jgi:hypothetical protein